VTSPLLTATEQALLLYLHDNRDRPVSRDELVREVWQEPYKTTSRTVDVTVGRIRRKLNAGIQTGAEIRTVRGAGYRYVGAELRPQLRPPAPIVRFVGREDILDSLHTWVQTRRGILTLVGTVGIGKSALVQQFARDRVSVQYLDLEEHGVPDALEPGRAVVLDNAHAYHSEIRAMVNRHVAQDLRVIVSTRYPLGLAMERVVRVPHLPPVEARQLVNAVLDDRTDDDVFIPQDISHLFGMPWLLVASACSGTWSAQAVLADALPRHRDARSVAAETLVDLAETDRSLLTSLLSGLGWVDIARIQGILGHKTDAQNSLHRQLRRGLVQRQDTEVCALPYLTHVLPIDDQQQEGWRDHLVQCVADPRFGHQWALQTRTGSTFARHLRRETVPYNIVRLTQALVRIANFSKSPPIQPDIVSRALAQTQHPAAIQGLRVDLALFDERDGNHERAIRQIRQSVDWFRANDSPAELVWAVTWAGLLERNQGHTDAAMRDIREAYAVGMDHGLTNPAASALLTIGAMHIDVGDYEASLGCSRGARALVPDDANIRTIATGNLGTALVLLGRGHEALREYESLVPEGGLPDVPVDPVQCLLLGNIAEAQVMAGKPEQASMTAKRSVLGFEQTTSTLTGAIQLIWAQAELLCGRPESALAILHRAKKREDRWTDRVQRWTHIALAEMNSPTPNANPLKDMAGWESVQRYDELVYAKLLAKRQR
jgi:tetratricopeptide (TPR) repeat protein